MACFFLCSCCIFLRCLALAASAAPFRRNSFLFSARNFAPGSDDFFLDLLCLTGRNGLFRDDLCAASVNASICGTGMLSNSERSGLEPVFGERMRRGIDENDLEGDMEEEEDEEDDEGDFLYDCGLRSFVKKRGSSSDLEED